MQDEDCVVTSDYVVPLAGLVRCGGPSSFVDVDAEFSEHAHSEVLGSVTDAREPEIESFFITSSVLLPIHD